jgi:hypothetical protein
MVIILHGSSDYKLRPASDGTAVHGAPERFKRAYCDYFVRKTCSILPFITGNIMTNNASSIPREASCDKTIKGAAPLVDYLAEHAPDVVPGLQCLVVFSRHDCFDIWFGTDDDGFDTMNAVADLTYDIQGTFPAWRFDYNVLQASTFPAHDDIAGADHVDVPVRRAGALT